MPRVWVNSSPETVLRGNRIDELDLLCKDWDDSDNLRTRRQVVSPQKAFKPYEEKLQELRSNPLCKYYTERMPLSHAQAHAAQEVWALRRIRAARSAAFCPSGLDVTQCVLHITKYLDVDPALRTSPVFTTPDANGVAFRYPHHGEIEVQLDRLSDAIRRNHERPYLIPLLALMWVFNCHPLADGNGRCARILFNLLTEEIHGSSDFYLPIGIWSAYSGGGFTLAVREAHFFGRWDPVKAWFQTLARIEYRSNHRGE